MLTYERRAGLSRLGYICSGLSIALVLIGVIAPLSGVLTVLLTVFLLFAWGIAVLFSIGLLLLSPEFLALPEKIFALVETAGEWTERFMTATPYMFGVSIALSLASVVLLSLEPSEKKHVGRIVVSVVFLVLAVAVLVIDLLNKTGGAA